jgi:hypothetical protein
MAPRSGTFAERLLRLKGAESYESLAKRMRAKGIDVTGQAIYKWCTGGGISLDTAQQVARFFDTSPGELLFGEDRRPVAADVSKEALLIARAFDRAPERLRRSVSFDLLQAVAGDPKNAKDRPFMAAVTKALDDLAKSMNRR